MNRICLLYFVLVVAMFTSSCWGDSGTCPSEPVQSFEIVDGTYSWTPDGPGNLEYGRPVAGELTVDLETELAVVEYEIDDGSVIVETYSFEAPVTTLISY